MIRPDVQIRSALGQDCYWIFFFFQLGLMRFPSHPLSITLVYTTCRHLFLSPLFVKNEEKERKIAFGIVDGSIYWIIISSISYSIGYVSAFSNNQFVYKKEKGGEKKGNLEVKSVPRSHPIPSCLWRWFSSLHTLKKERNLSGCASV